MVEIATGVLRAHCLDRRSAERERPVCAIADWERKRNAAGACTKWMFTTDCARTKLSRAYPLRSRFCSTGPHSKWGAWITLLPLPTGLKLLSEQALSVLDFNFVALGRLDAANHQYRRTRRARSLTPYDTAAIGEADPDREDERSRAR
jgi:hypothetical protein